MEHDFSLEALTTLDPKTLRFAAMRLEIISEMFAVGTYIREVLTYQVQSFRRVADMVENHKAAMAG